MALAHVKQEIPSDANIQKITDICLVSAETAQKALTDAFGDVESAIAMLLSAANSDANHQAQLQAQISARKVAEHRAQTAENANDVLRGELARQRKCAVCAPEIDLSSDASAATASATVGKRKLSALHETRKRLAVVKQEKLEALTEKQEALLDVDDERQTTQYTALSLDRHMTYVDELKKQLVAAGQEPLLWIERNKAPPKFQA